MCNVISVLAFKYCRSLNRCGIYLIRLCFIPRNNIRLSQTLVLLLFLMVQPAHAQNRFNVSLDLSLYYNDYAAHPLSALVEFQGGNRRRLFIRSGINANNRSGFNLGVPIVFGFYSHPASKNHFEMGIGTTLFFSEQLPPYDYDKKIDVGPNGIIVPLAYRRELPKGLYFRLGITPFLSYSSEIVPSLAVGIRLKSRTEKETKIEGQ